MGIRSQNNPLAAYLDVFSNTGTDAAGGVGPGIELTATGGVISEYTSGSDVYRAHIFTSSGIFEVFSPVQIEYLVVAGGGGGGGEAQSGGGGAGGFRTNLAGHPVKAADYTATIGEYTVTVGGGGVGGIQNTTDKAGTRGGNSEFYPTPVSYPSTARVRSVGGGGGVGYAGNPVDGNPGGSGGGTFNRSGSSSGGAGNTPTDPNHPQVQGYKGGDSPTYVSPHCGGGGGGAGGEGAPDNPSGPFPGAGGVSQGGYGLQALIAGPPASPQPMGTPGPGSGAAATGYFAGGGGGGGYDGHPESAEEVVEVVVQIPMVLVEKVDLVLL